MGLGKALKKITNVGLAMPTGGLSLLNNGTSKSGNILNDITGASSAAKQSQKYALQSAQIANEYQKEFAQNAHQWEVADLEKAGINPILYAGSGAPAGAGSVNSAQMQSSGHNPLEIAGMISNIIQQTHQNKLSDTTSEKQKEETGLTTEKKKTEKIQQELLEKQKQEMEARIKKIEEETNKITYGQASNVLGTGIINTAVKAGENYYNKKIEKIKKENDEMEENFKKQYPKLYRALGGK